MKMKIKNYEFAANSAKVTIEYGKETFYCYCYKGNARQNFVVNANKENITNTKKGQRLLIEALCYSMNIWYNT